MVKSCVLKMALVCTVMTSVIGCSPHVFKQDEFERDSPTFNKEPKDVDGLTVCYNGIVSSEGEVVTVAEQACDHYGKAAELTGTGFGVCPLFTPTEARFACRKLASVD